MSPEPGTVTQLLRELQEGNRDAQSKLLDVVYRELHRIAARYMRKERVDHTLQPTALVNEAYLRLLGEDCPSLENRQHFFAVAAQMMRRILVDYARSYRSEKRGGQATHVRLEDCLAFRSENATEIIALDEAHSCLSQVDPRQSRIVELRFFVGLNEAQIAELLMISRTTVMRDWRVAKAWLYSELRAAEK